MMATRAGSKRLLRDLNQSIVLNLIAEEGLISRIELSRRSGLPAATITRIVNEFLVAGLVSEVQLEEATNGGRRPILLGINPLAGYIVGVKLTESFLTVVLCDLHCTILHSCHGHITQDTTPYKIVEVIAETVKRCLKEAGISAKRVLGVGVGLAGLIDTKRGICHYSPMLHWHNVELGPALEFQLRLPVRIDNDVNTLAIAQRQFGDARNTPDFLLIVIGPGVGMGVIIRGEVYRGAFGGAGEFGHITVDTSVNAPVCHCGKRGCLEAFISDYALVRAITGEDAPFRATGELFLLVERARAGDEKIRAVFAQAGRVLGEVIANLINIFDPVQVLIERMPAAEFMLDAMNAAIAEHVFGQLREDIIMIVSQADEIAWARGAASVIARELFQPPIYDTHQNIVIDDLLSKSNNHRSSKRWGLEEG